LDWLYDNDIILDIDGMFFKNINVKYYPVSEDPLDVPEVKTKEAHFVRINLEAIKSYPSFTEQLEEIQKINNLMN
jgi:7,8-dihydro-6-hydroxymethylpterin-pyrophosphokinase